MVFCCTPPTGSRWMLPGGRPTGRRVGIPLLAVVKFRGDKLYHEHIYWDRPACWWWRWLAWYKRKPSTPIDCSQNLRLSGISRVTKGCVTLGVVPQPVWLT